MRFRNETLVGNHVDIQEFPKLQQKRAVTRNRRIQNQLHYYWSKYKTIHFQFS